MIEPTFSDAGPFDARERAVIREVFAAIDASRHAQAEELLGRARATIELLDRMGGLLSEYPTLLTPTSLGSRRRNLTSLCDMLAQANFANLDLMLPTRALVARNLVMGEVNFYRLLRVVCEEALPPGEAGRLRGAVDELLCHALYTRLCEELLIHIASDEALERRLREKAVVSLGRIWEQASYRIDDFFPVLEATWEARRRISATLGTLMGTSEMFALLRGGCDPKFVDYLVRPDHTDDEEGAFREFLLGATIEQLARLEQHMTSAGVATISRADLPGLEQLSDPSPNGLRSDPALALFEFFLARHLQAAARRQAGLPGPKRTAEAYVLLHYLEQEPDSGPPAG